MSAGVAPEKALSDASGKASACRSHDADVRVAGNELKQLKAEYTTTVEEKKEADKNFNTVLGTIKTKVDAASAVEKDAFNPNSVVVLNDLKSADKAVYVKWMLITSIVTIIELLHFLIKIMFGQSALGMRVASERMDVLIEVEEAIRQKDRDAAINESLSNLTINAMEAIRNSPYFKELFIKYLTVYIEGMVPFEGARAINAEIVRMGADKAAIISKYPQFVEVVSEAYSRAIQESARILRQAASVSAATGA